MQGPMKGVFPIAPTPFFDDGAIDFDGMKRVIDCIVDQGADAVCALANFSEQFVLSDEERDELETTIIEHVAGRIPVIVTISHFGTGLVVERLRRAQSKGAAMVMLMPPYHGATLKVDEAQMFEHFRAVDGASNISVIVQDAPLSGVELRADFLARLASELEHVRYFKLETPFAADKMAALIAKAEGSVLGPFDGEEGITLLADLDAGATGCMTSALMPEKIAEIVDRHAAGDERAMLGLWSCYLPLINHENRQCGLRAAKAVMKQGGVIRSDYVRHPQSPLSDRTRSRLLSLASDADLIALRWGV